MQTCKRFNDTHREKLCLTQFSIRMAAWLTFFICLDNELSTIHFIITYERVQMFEKCNLSNRQ